MYKFDERKKSTFDNTDTCLPSPKNKYSPYVCRSKSNIDVQPFPSCLMKRESANSSMNSQDSLLNTDEAGDRTLGMGDRGQEFDPDMGYCSHSTSSSSHNMDQGTELDYCQSYPSDLSDVEGEGNGTDKMEDVVQQFGKYFQGQFHQMLHQFQSSVHCMLDEQQDHLRHIINFVTKCNQSGVDVHDFHPEQSSLPCEESAREQELHVGLTDKSCSLEEMDALPPLEDSDFSEFYWTNDMRQSDSSNSQISNFASSEYQSSMIPYTKTQETSKDRLLLHVFSLTSGVNNLLQKPEFKT